MNDFNDYYLLRCVFDLGVQYHLCFEAEDHMLWTVCGCLTERWTAGTHPDESTRICPRCRSRANAESELVG